MHFEMTHGCDGYNIPHLRAFMHNSRKNIMIRKWLGTCDFYIWGILGRNLRQRWYV